MVQRLTGTRIEIIRAVSTPVDIRVAVLDFDGTLSLIRGGWQSVMVSMMVEELAALGTGESHDALWAEVSAFVDRLTGEPTILQMEAFCRALERRGARCESAEHYKERYLARLSRTTHSRLTALEAETVRADELMVPGARSLLERLVRDDIVCYLASGTDHEQVVEEASGLGIAHYFAGGIYGARPEPHGFSKGRLMKDLARDHGLKDHQLAAFGDGPVEIRECARLGGIAIGVATHEAERGTWDVRKHEQLTAAGAHVLVPDLAEHAALMDYLCAGCVRRE